MRSSTSFLKLLHHMIPIVPISSQQLAHLFKARKNRNQLLKLLAKMNLRVHGGTLDFNAIQHTQNLTEFAKHLSHIPKIRIEMENEHDEINYLGVTNSQLKEWIYEITHTRITDQHQSTQNLFLDSQTLSVLFSNFFKTEYDDKLKKFYRDAIAALIELEPSNLLVHDFQFEMCEALMRKETSLYQTLASIHPVFSMYLKNTSEQKTQRYQGIEKEKLLTLFESYYDVMKVFNTANDPEFKTIKDPEIQSLLNQKIEMYRIEYHDHTQLFPITVNEVYLYLPKMAQSECFISFNINQQHRFFQFDDADCIRRLITTFGHLFKKELYWQHPFSWEQIRSRNAQQEDVMDTSVWSNQLTHMYDQKVEDLYSNTIRPRLFHSFKQIVSTIPSKTKLKLFEVGAGNGEIGIQCAEYAAQMGFSVILYPSDIHLENAKKIEKHKPKTFFQIKSGKASSDSIEQYFQGIQSSTESNVISILISCGCLCFNIIPGGIHDDLQLMQKMHRYHIDWIIADGLEIPIINTRIARSYYRTKTLENFDAPKGTQTGMHICLERQELKIEEDPNLTTLNLSFHSDPVSALFKVISEPETSKFKLDVLDLRYAYIEQRDVEKLMLIFEKLLDINPKLYIYLSESAMKWIRATAYFPEIKHHIVAHKENVVDDFSIMTGEMISGYKKPSSLNSPSLLFQEPEKEPYASSVSMFSNAASPNYYFSDRSAPAYHFLNRYDQTRTIKAIEVLQMKNGSCNIAIHTIPSKEKSVHCACAILAAECINSESSFSPRIMSDAEQSFVVVPLIKAGDFYPEQKEIENFFNALNKIEHAHCFDEFQNQLMQIIFPFYSPKA